MRPIISIAVVTIFMLPASHAQVDTLQLVEIGNIEAPSEISELYVEDLDSDSLKEIILTTVNNVHIYNGITYEPIWTSPQIDPPRDLNFADINLDGFIDFSVKDTTNIRLFDPHNDSVIWTSPELDSTFKCYTIGDRNNDNMVDLGLVNLSHTDIPDTATYCIRLYESQNFTLADSFFINLLRAVEDPANFSKNYPIAIYFEKLRNDSGIVNTIMLATRYRSYSDGWPSYFGNNGYIYLYNSVNFNLIIDGVSGILSRYMLYENDDMNRVLYCAGIFSAGMGDPYPTSQGGFRLSMFSIDTFEVILEYDNYYPGAFYCLLGEILAGREGPEFYFWHSFENSIIRFAGYSVLDREFLWLNDYPQGFAMLSRDTFIDYNIFSSPEIALRHDSSVLSFFNTQSGNCDAVVLHTNIRPIIYDLNADGNTELIKINGVEIIVYRLSDPTAVGDNDYWIRSGLITSNYPNPFNSSTTIQYGLPEAGEVRIEIFDLLGREVQTLVKGKQDAGIYSITWDAGDQASGVYFYRITAGEFVQTRRMVLVK